MIENENYGDGFNKIVVEDLPEVIQLILNSNRDINYPKSILIASFHKAIYCQLLEDKIISDALKNNDISSEQICDIIRQYYNSEFHIRCKKDDSKNITNYI